MCDYTNIVTVIIIINIIIIIITAAVFIKDIFSLHILLRRTRLKKNAI